MFTFIKTIFFCLFSFVSVFFTVLFDMCDEIEEKNMDNCNSCNSKVNPASGLSMTGVFDCGGNTYGNNFD